MNLTAACLIMYKHGKFTQVPKKEKKRPEKREVGEMNLCLEAIEKKGKQNHNNSVGVTAPPQTQALENKKKSCKMNEPRRMTCTYLIHSKNNGVESIVFWSLSKLILKFSDAAIFFSRSLMKFMKAFSRKYYSC